MSRLDPGKTLIDDLAYQRLQVMDLREAENASRGLSYTDTELSLEQLMSSLGAERYQAQAAAAKEKHAETTVGPGKMLLRKACGMMDEAFEEWMEGELKKSGPLGHAAEELGMYDPGILSTVTCKVMLDSISMRRTIAACAKAVASAVEDDARFAHFRAEVPKLWDALKRGFKHNSAYGSKRRKIIEVMRQLEMTWEPWVPSKKIRVGMVLVDLFIESTGLVMTQSVSERGSKRKRLYVVATLDTLEWMEKSHEAHEALTPFYLPMRDVPAPWTTVHDGGYLTNLVRRVPLIKTRDSRHLEEAEAADLDQVMACVNTLQGSAWEVNTDVYEVAAHVWETSASCAGLPPREDTPLPHKPDDIDTNLDNRRLWRRKAAVVYDQNVGLRSRRMQSSRILYMAKMFRDGPFYFPYTCDFRGRIYPVPQFLQPQGPSLARGLLRFSDGKPVGTEEAALLFAAHGANKFGEDKGSMAARAAWAWDNLARIQAVADEPLENRWWEGADSPWEFLAWCLEFAAFSQVGLSFVSKIPVSMDGSNNGLQIFSLLLRDRVGGHATNCTDTDLPQDIYGQVAEEVTTLLCRDSELRGSDDAQKSLWALKWLKDIFGGRVPREAVKRSVMTLPYGSTKYSCQRYVLDWVDTIFQENPFDKDNYRASWYLVGLIWEGIDRVVVAAQLGMAWLQECARTLALEDQPMVWVSPTGFPVRQAYRSQRWTTVETHIGDRTRWTKIRVNKRKGKTYNTKSMVNGISPNVVHSLDAAALVKTVNSCVPKGVFNFAMVHDDFGVLAADAPTMALTLRAEYAAMFTPDLLSNLRDQWQALAPEGVELPPVPSYGDLDPKEVMAAQFFFA